MMCHCIKLGILAAVFVLSNISGELLSFAVEPYRDSYAAAEAKLLTAAKKLPAPQPGEWLYEHPEKGQSFDEYRRTNPIRRSPRQRTIYIAQIGEFSESQQKILAATQAYLQVFFDAPVKLHNTWHQDDLPESARRLQPTTGNPQVLTGHVLHELLVKNRPQDTLAYVAFTADDLWSREANGKDWNYVFGEASLKERVGVWSLWRFGDPGGGEQDYLRCLRLTIGTAVHETCHILTMPHCVDFECAVNGSNHLNEAETKPLYLCPTCLRKLCWNLGVEPKSHCRVLEKHCRNAGLNADADYYRQAIELLTQ